MNSCFYFLYVASLFLVTTQSYCQLAFKFMTLTDHQMNLSYIQLSNSVFFLMELLTQLAWIFVHRVNGSCNLLGIHEKSI